MPVKDRQIRIVKVSEQEDAAEVFSNTTAPERTLGNDVAIDAGRLGDEGRTHC